SRCRTGYAWKSPFGFFARARRSRITKTLVAFVSLCCVVHHKNAYLPSSIFFRSCPLLAQSGHAVLQCKCRLSELKRTSLRSLLLVRISLLLLNNPLFC